MQSNQLWFDSLLVEIIQLFRKLFYVHVLPERKRFNSTIQIFLGFKFCTFLLFSNVKLCFTSLKHINSTFCIVTFMEFLFFELLEPFDICEFSTIFLVNILCFEKNSDEVFSCSSLCDMMNIYQVCSEKNNCAVKG